MSRGITHETVCCSCGKTIGGCGCDGCHKSMRVVEDGCSDCHAKVNAAPLELLNHDFGSRPISFGPGYTQR